MKKLKPYLIVTISILLWLILLWYIERHPSSSFTRSVIYRNYAGYTQLTDDLFLKQYLAAKDDPIGGGNYSWVLTDTISFAGNIGSHGTDVTLEFIICKKHVTVKVYTKIDASDSRAREAYRVPEEIPWEKEYKRLDDILEIELPPEFKSTQTVDSVIVFIPR